ncbi:hypothetical protein [Gorillibacterium massiliense]|uniref:hypothetical protein n=1 Tax=Gorillibacterium massiliense TaxID=1280390 RepID=UPI0004AE74D2|nr:hypothetical protein [Gorillibacterium massiliense]
MLQLGQKIIIIGDNLEQNLPIGEYGYIIAYERNADNVFDYVVRIPKTNRHVFVTVEDIEVEEVLFAQEADRIEREALIDFALATKNEDLFKRVMNGEPVETLQEPTKEVTSPEDFIKQINLKAWI